MAPLDPITQPQPFIVPPFLKTASIDAFHSRFRFGFSNDINKLITGEDKPDYFVGIIISSVVLLCVFIVWAAIILLLRVAGRERVGFFSGHPPQRPAPPTGCIHLLELTEEENGEEEPKTKSERTTEEREVEPEISNKAQEGEVDNSLNQENGESAIVTTNSEGEDTDLGTENEAAAGSEIAPDNPELTTAVESTDGDPSVAGTESAFEDWKAKCRKVDRAVQWSRLVLILSGLAIIVSSLMFMAVGVRYLGRSVDDIFGVTQRVYGLAEKGIDLIDEHLGAQEELAIAAVSSYNILSLNLCPLLQRKLCRNISSSGEIDASACDLTNVTFRNETIEFLRVLNETLFLNTTLHEGFLQPFRLLQGDLSEIQDRSMEVNNLLHQFRWAYYVALGFVILFNILVIVMLIGVYWAWRKRVPRAFVWAQRRVIVPATLFLVFLVIVFTIVFLAGGTVGADFCTDDPDRTTRNVVMNLEGSFNTIVYDMILYYVDKCAEAPRFFQPYQQFLESIHTLTLSVHSFNEGILRLSASDINACGTDSMLIHAWGQIVDDQLHVLFNAADSVRAFFFCENFHPLYVSSVYDALCRNGVNAMRWTVGSLAAITACSMIMVTFRGVWYETQDEIDTLSRLTERVDQERELHTVEKSDRQPPL